jgi:hypothetical protein
VGPPLRVVSTYPENGEGFDCPISDLECGVPIDAVFEVRFDRYLLPSTAVRQSFAVYSGIDTNPPLGADVPALTPRYDLVERVVTYELPPGVTLQPNTHYTMELIVPKKENDFGFRAFDLAPLDDGGTLTASFLTSNQRKTPGPTTADGTCNGTVATLNTSCVFSGCHNRDDREMGLDFSEPNALVRTTIGRVAHQTETGPKTGTPTQNPDRFGVAMPLVDPGRPDNSYLLYKLLLSPENYWFLHGEPGEPGEPDVPDVPDLCGTRHQAPVGEGCVSVLAAPEENERLQDWFLRGVGMPRSREGKETIFLERWELRDLESWIRAGASCQ